MTRKIENKNLVIFDGIDEEGKIKYKSFEEYINETFNNKQNDILGNLFIECMTKYVFVRDNHLIHFSQAFSLIEEGKIQEGLLVKEENLEKVNFDELQVANHSYYKMSNKAYEEVITILTNFTKLSVKNTEDAIENEFKNYVVRKRK